MITMMEDVKLGIQNTLNNIDECDVSLSTFNDELYIDASVSKSSSFTIPELHCAGCTRLYDCLVEVLSKEITSTDTMIVVLTDGLNNKGNSTPEDVRKLLLNFKKNNNIVKFLGANMDAVLNASEIGVQESDALNYDHMNVTHALRAVSDNILELQRSGINVPFLLPQRAASISTPRTNTQIHTQLHDNLGPPMLRRCNSMLS